MYAFDVKISADGAKMTRLSNYMLLNFSTLQAKEDVMSFIGKGKKMFVRLVRYQGQIKGLGL